MLIGRSTAVELSGRDLQVWFGQLIHIEPYRYLVVVLITFVVVVVGIDYSCQIVSARCCGHAPGVHARPFVFIRAEPIEFAEILGRDGIRLGIRCGAPPALHLHVPFRCRITTVVPLEVEVDGIFGVEMLIGRSTVIKLHGRDLQVGFGRLIDVEHLGRLVVPRVALRRCCLDDCRQPVGSWTGWHAPRKIRLPLIITGCQRANTAIGDVVGLRVGRCAVVPFDLDVGCRGITTVVPQEIQAN